MGQPVFRFPTKGRTSAEIRYFMLVRALGDLHDTECQRFWGGTSNPTEFPLTLVGAGLIVNESLPLTPAVGVSQVEFSV